MTWKDPNVPLPDAAASSSSTSQQRLLHGRGPSKLSGSCDHRHARQRGHNPVFEFDSCFDPSSSNKATGVTIRHRDRDHATTATAVETRILVLAART